jgi:hypothetical protein
LSGAVAAEEGSLGGRSRASDFELLRWRATLVASREGGSRLLGALEEKPDSHVEASESGIFAELVSISSTRSAGVSDSAYFIKSIEIRPTFDLFLSARKGLHFFGRVPSGETLIVLWFCPTHRLTNQANPQLKRAVAGRGAGA